MFVYVLNKKGKPLMPCKPAIARLLLKGGKAKVKTRTPFIIQLAEETTEFKQPITGGMDTGSKFIGCAATSNGEVLYQSEIKLRADVSKKMQQRAMYRRTRRGRKCRYRPARWANRASMRKDGRLAPSIRSKVDSHLREKNQVESILPITNWKVETASFQGTGFVKGKRSTGYFALENIMGEKIHASANIKKKHGTANSPYHDINSTNGERK